jgi:putative membrane protein
MGTRWMTTALVAAAVALGPGWGFAQTTTERATADKGAKMASSDRKFVMEALKGGMAEVELGKLASERAASDAVKQFGKRMADDHGKAGDELMKLAQDKGVAAPSALDGKHARLRDKLAKLSGADFDRAYVGEMVKDHRQDVKDFRREADKAKDPDVKAFAAKTLPTLEDHLKQVEDLNAQVKGTAKAPKK